MVARHVFGGQGPDTDGRTNHHPQSFGENKQV